jgi:hypothetical protein
MVNVLADFTRQTCCTFELYMLLEDTVPREFKWRYCPPYTRYSHDRTEVYVLRKLQCGFTSMESWCEHWNVKISEVKNQAIYFSQRPKQIEARVTFNGWSLPFIDHAKYLDVIFGGSIVWRLQTETITAKAFRKFLRACPLFRCRRISCIIKLTFRKAPLSQ